MVRRFKSVRLLVSVLLWPDFLTEQTAVNDDRNEVTQTVSTFFEFICHSLDLTPVSEGHWAAQGIGTQFVNHRSCELILSVSHEVALQALHSVQWLLVVENGVGIDRYAIDVGAEATDGIEVF